MIPSSVPAPRWSRSPRRADPIRRRCLPSRATVRRRTERRPATRRRWRPAAIGRRCGCPPTTRPSSARPLPPRSHVVVVVVSGSAVVMPWADDVAAVHPVVVLRAWRAAPRSPRSSSANPSRADDSRSRFRTTRPISPSSTATPTAIEYDLFHGQWLLDRDGVEAHFPFGWGLGFGRSVEDGVLIDDQVGVGSTVRNTRGSRHVDGRVRPRRRRRVGVRRPSRRSGRVRPHRTRTPARVATATIDPDWSMLDIRVDGTWVTEPGTYLVDVGLHAHDPRRRTLQIDRG